MGKNNESHSSEIAEIYATICPRSHGMSGNKTAGTLLSAVCHEQPVSASEVGQHAVSWSGVKFVFQRPCHHLKSGWWRWKPRFWVNLPVCWLQAINIVSGWKLIKPGILQISASLVILLESPNQLHSSSKNENIHTSMPRTESGCLK